MDTGSTVWFRSLVMVAALAMPVSVMSQSFYGSLVAVVEDAQSGVMPGAPGDVGELRAGCGHRAGVDADHGQAVGGRHRRRGEQCGERRAEDDDGAREAHASAHASSTGRRGRAVPQAASGIPDGSSKRPATSLRMSSIASVAGER